MKKPIFRAMLAAMAGAILLPSASFAVSSPAEQAAEMMARAQAMDMKCNFLAAHEKDKLSKFTARAELALATRESTAETKAAMQRGRDAAKAAACSAEEKSTVEQILAAALAASGEGKAAMRQKDGPPKPVAEAPAAATADSKTPAPPAKPGPVAAAEAQKPKAPALAPVKTPVASAGPKTRQLGLATYENLAAAYYRARRCGGNQAAAYQAVLAAHGRVMQGHSASEVAAALRRAQARAQARACS